MGNSVHQLIRGRKEYDLHPAKRRKYTPAGLDVKRYGLRAIALAPPDVIARTLEVLTGDEFGARVAAIVKLAEDPDGITFSDTVRDKRGKGTG